MEEKEKKLTPKQILFVEAYLGEAHFNARLAAQLAGYKGSTHTLTQHGYIELQKPKVQEYVKLRLAEAAMSADEVLMRVGKQARSSIEMVLDDEGRFDFAKAKENKSLDLVKKIKVSKISQIETVIEVEMYSSHEARALLMKHHGLLVEQHEHAGKGGGPIQEKLTIEVIKSVKRETSGESSD